MPRIPTVNAPGIAQNVPQTPDVIPTYQTPNIGSQISEFGTSISRILGNLANQQDQLEFHNMKATRETGVAAIKLKLDKDPATQDAPDAYAKMFEEEVNRLDQQITTGSKSSNGSVYYGRYVQQQYQKDLVQAQAHGAKLFATGQITILGITSDRMAKQAVDAFGDSAKQEEIFKEHARMWENAAFGDDKTPPLVSQADALKQIHEFSGKVQEGTMATLVGQDRQRLRAMERNGAFGNVPPAKRASYLEQANKADEHNDNLIAKQDTARAQEYYQGLMSMAAAPEVRGELSDTIIDNGIAGLDPIIKDVDKWIHVKKMKENPPGSAGNQQLEIIASKFALSRQTRADAETALAETNQLQDSLPAPNKAVTKFGEHINTTLRTLRSIEASEASQGRAVRGEGRAEQREGRSETLFPGQLDAQKRAQRNAEITAAIKSYEDQLPPVPTFQMSAARERHQRDKDKAAIQTMINQGVPGPDAVKSVIDKRSIKTKATPNALPGAPGQSQTDLQQKLQDALKGLPR